MGTPQLKIRSGHPDFLDLPWGTPVDNWDSQRLVEMPAGIHRHPVVFVAYEQEVYAIKELPRRLANNEFDVLVRLEDRTHVTAEPAGLVDRVWLPDDVEQSGAVITTYVRHSFPYRHLVTGAGFGARRRQLSDALAGLLVELHLAGCYWGDCSLSNVLCRFDAGAIEAIMIDGETSEIRDTLSTGQRQEDIEIMKENVAGALFDVAAEAGTEPDDQDLRLGPDAEARYHSLWNELKGEMVIAANEGYLVGERIRRINDLGFSVGDVELTPVEGGSRVALRVEVGGRTYHSQRLVDLTGIEASENQARTILNDVNTFVARDGGISAVGKSVSTMKWRLSRFDPATEWIAERWHGSDPIQGFCDYLVFKGALDAARSGDVEMEEGLKEWAGSGFPGFPLD